MKSFSDRDIDRLRADGYLIVEGFLDANIVRDVRRDLFERYPEPHQYFAQPDAHEWLRAHPFAGFMEFPFQSDILNAMAVHPALVDLAERVLLTPDIRLFKSNVWAKYAEAADYDQPLHRDYADHTLVVPVEEPIYDQLIAFIYYSDVSLENGPTYIVAARDSNHVPAWVTECPRAQYPELYLAERPVLVPAGSLLLYMLRTFHRGSALISPAASRFIQTMGYRSLQCEWGGFQSWPRTGKQPELTTFIQRATPRERELFGFPRPGHPYWTPSTIDAVQRRYPGMDVSPYREAASLDPHWRKV